MSGDRREGLTSRLLPFGRYEREKPHPAISEQLAREDPSVISMRDLDEAAGLNTADLDNVTSTKIQQPPFKETFRNFALGFAFAGLTLGSIAVGLYFFGGVGGGAALAVVLVLSTGAIIYRTIKDSPRKHI